MRSGLAILDCNAQLSLMAQRVRRKVLQPPPTPGSTRLGHIQQAVALDELPTGVLAHQGLRVLYCHACDWPSGTLDARVKCRFRRDDTVHD